MGCNYPLQRREVQRRATSGACLPARSPIALSKKAATLPATPGAAPHRPLSSRNKKPIALSKKIGIIVFTIFCDLIYLCKLNLITFEKKGATPFVAA
jgi:hypothetical protein